MFAEFQRARPSRIICLAICYAVMAGVLLMRLVYWQAVRRGDVLQYSPGDASISTMAWRGTIQDCHGHYLAIPSLVYDVGASPQMITDRVAVATTLAPLIGLPVPDLLGKLDQKDPVSQKPVSFVPLARGLSTAKGREIKALKFQGIKLDVRPGRFYPEGRLAAAVLGFVSGEQQSYYGVEEYYDTRLRGASGFKMASGPQVLFDLPVVQAPRNGLDLVLTIDRVVQRAAEKNLEQALREYEAESGVIIVMEPRTGAVLAIAVAPGYDPNAFAKVRSPADYVNAAISWQYEPGSVFKMVTMAAGLDAGVIRPDDTYYDEGKVEVGERTFQNWDRKAHGQVTMTQVLARSLNLGAIYVARKLGTTRFYDAVRRFGFGEPTGIDLAGEIAGTVRMPGSPDWYPADLAANSFGQGVAVTPIQMTTAVAAIANGGLLMRPYVVDRILDGDRVVWEARPQVVRRVVSEEAARELTEMLVAALPEETPLGVVPEYAAAGKTGTAQVFEQGRYDDQAIIASFAGYLPARDPRFVVLVKLDRPKRQPWGSRAAAPVWRSLATELCVYMGIPPDGARLATN
ncbi:MAG: penicillin-binding protein 2 [Anaerolineae bacterium]|nr:penicillin-binding protein 2 [Anaerolineae bacterium]